MTEADSERLRSVRRRLHRYPEPAWREFMTTSLLVDELETIGVDELAVGRDAIAAEHRMAVPSEEELEPWFERAREAGAREDVLELTAGGHTGVVAVLRRGEGPSVGLRVDIDGLHCTESDDPDHVPAAEGFRSEHDGMMHACGHDAHMTMGLGVLEAVKESDFQGTFTVFFQPAEEEAGGGKAMAESPYADGLDYLFGVHVGLNHPTGEVVAGMVEPLAMAHFTAEFEGTSAHAGKAPNTGANAILATATAIQNLYTIPRHEDGMTRVNVGRMSGGSASNVIAEEASIFGEVRGETTALMEYMKREVERTLYAAAEMHDCDVDLTFVSESPRADSDPELARVVQSVASEHPDVNSTPLHAPFGASEDATFLMERVQREGGLSTYAIVGTDHPTNHHTPTFDVDEASIGIGVDVLADAVLSVSRDGSVAAE